jgi:hypothetical protein
LRERIPAAATAVGWKELLAVEKEVHRLGEELSRRVRAERLLNELDSITTAIAVHAQSQPGDDGQRGEPAAK